MKKYSVAIVILAVCVGFAFASSVKVPWYVDTSPAEGGNPPRDNGVIGLVTLTSNADEIVTCQISYYSAAGVDVGIAPQYASNTFEIAPLSSLAFRPVMEDPDATCDPPGAGQEGQQAVLVPDRNTSDGQKNGSIVIEWDGDPDLIQGNVSFVKQKNGLVVSYQHLLPAGVAGV